MNSAELPENNVNPENIRYVNYESETQMPHIMDLMDKDLSEPYSVYTYRYFINDWRNLCFMVSNHGISIVSSIL